MEWTAYDDEQDARDHEEMVAWYSHVDALLVNGVDAGYERRAYMRSLVTERQKAEAAGEKARGAEHDWAGARADELARIAALRLHNKETGGDKRREGRHGKGVKGGARQRARRRRRVSGGAEETGGERPRA